MTVLEVPPHHRPHIRVILVTLEYAFFVPTVGRSLAVGKEVKNGGTLFAFHPPLLESH